MWLLGDSQRSQKTKLEERAVPHLITSMDDLTLNSSHNYTNSAHNRSVHRSPSYDLLQSEASEIGLGLTQGDKLRALKSRRPPRASTTEALRYQN